jgi:hypothetical protein
MIQPTLDASFLMNTLTIHSAIYLKDLRGTVGCRAPLELSHVSDTSSSGAAPSADGAM